MKIIYFLQNHSINLPEIWSDCSIYVCIWLFLFMFLVIWLANNYKRSVRIEAEEKAETKVLAISHELDNLNLQNCYLKEQYLAKQKEVDSLNEQLKQKRNPDVTFAITSGKGQGKKKDWTKASKEELLAEAKSRYPIGTCVECVKYSYDNEIITGHDHNADLDEDLEIWFDAGCIGMCVYANGLWAKIIK